LPRAAANHPVGRLVSIIIGDNKEAAVYVRAQANAAREVGFRFDDARWPSSLTQEECKARIVAMNDDPDVLGVILQRPVPNTSTAARSRRGSPAEGRRGMNPASIGNIVYNDLALAPCTAAASVELIKATGLESARPRGRDDRPLGDRGEAGGVHADGEGAPSPCVIT
jgi:methylenetetrahydrofolate dehydrogenase (NADP+)/methenyltetrahydrofolate cyclohydrolase